MRVELEEKNSCKCKDEANTRDECINHYTVRDSNNTVKLEPKNSSEKVCAIIVEG